LVKESPAAEHCGSPLDTFPQAQHPQDPHAIRRQVDPRADRWPRCAPFNELWNVAPTVQGRCQREACNATPNDQDPFNVSHGVIICCNYPFSSLASRRMFNHSCQNIFHGFKGKKWPVLIRSLVAGFDSIPGIGNDVLHNEWREITNDEVEAAHHYTQRILEDLYDDRATVEALLKQKGELPA
jgi:hypothetical protein